MAEAANIDSVVKKGHPSWEAHELVLDAIPDERLDDPITDERIMNFAVSGQLQAVLVRPHDGKLAVVEGRQRVKRALVINHLVGRHAYRGPLKSVKAAIDRLTGTDIGKRIVEECPRGMKVLVTVHRGDEQQAIRDSVVANEHRDDDPLERKVRKAKRLAKQGFSPAEIAGDFGVSEQTIGRWLARDPDAKRVKKMRGATTMPKAKIRKVLDAGTPELSAREHRAWRRSPRGGASGASARSMPPSGSAS